jgi:hypothetical protein
MKRAMTHVGLALVDELHEHPLVLEHVTLRLQVELVVQVAVDLLALTVSLHRTRVSWT